MEEEGENEYILTGYPKPILYECTKKIIEQMEKNICKIKIGNIQGTGFFCKIPFPTKELMIPVLITNNHIIDDKILYKKDAKIQIDIKEKENIKYINLNDRLKYTNENYDITIIELKQEDYINNFLELDDIIINSVINDHNENKEYIDKTVYILQYPEGDLSVSYGNIIQIFEKDNYNFKHKCCTMDGSSGSPILNVNKNKVIGIHSKGYKNYNKGAFLNYAIKDFIDSHFDPINRFKLNLEYNINEILLEEIKKKFCLDIKNAKIEKLNFIEKYIGKEGFKELKELILYYKNKYNFNLETYNKKFLGLEFHKKLIEQMENSICEIRTRDIEIQETGFFCKIPFPTKENMIPILITNNHIIDDYILFKKDAKIQIYIKKEKYIKYINLNNRMKYTNKGNDITIIELKEEDNINNYLELDDIIMDDILNNIDRTEEYINENVYTLRFEKYEVLTSYGYIERIYNEKNYEFLYKCNAGYCSPIININNKVLGYHKYRKVRDKLKPFKDSPIGVFLNYPIKIFIQKFCYNNEKYEKILQNNLLVEKFNLIYKYIGNNIFQELESVLPRHYDFKLINDGFEYDEIRQIAYRMEKTVCKIKVGNKQGTGFFCKIPFPNLDKMIRVIITSNNILNKNLFENEIEISIGEEKDIKKLNLNNRIKYTSEIYNITIIEIKEEDDKGVLNYLELDKIIINDIINKEQKMKIFEGEGVCEIICDKNIYMMGYHEENLSVTYGISIIRERYEIKKFNFLFLGRIKGNSLGSPILIGYRNKVIGMLIKEYPSKFKRYGFKMLGVFLNYPIIEFIEQNCIKIKNSE